MGRREKCISNLTKKKKIKNQYKCPLWLWGFNRRLCSWPSICPSGVVFQNKSAGTTNFGTLKFQTQIQIMLLFRVTIGTFFFSFLLHHPCSELKWSSLWLSIIQTKEEYQGFKSLDQTFDTHLNIFHEEFKSTVRQWNTLESRMTEGCCLLFLIHWIIH